MNLFPPNIIAEAEASYEPVQKPEFNIPRRSLLESLSSFKEPRLTIGDLMIRYKPTRNRATLTYPFLKGEVKATAEPGNYWLQYSRDF